MSESEQRMAYNEPNKRWKQTSILDFVRVETRSGSDCPLLTEKTHSSGAQLAITCDDNACTQAVDMSSEVMECSQSSLLSDLSEIPETPEEMVGSNDEMDSEDESQAMSGLNRMPECVPPLPPLRADSRHYVLFRVPLSGARDAVPEPYPHCYCDKWDAKHVKMPNSPHNLITALQSVEGRSVRTRVSKWELIQENLLSDMKSAEQLEEAIKTYNPFVDKYDFDVLHQFFDEHSTQEERIHFFDAILPEMCRLALQLPQIVTQSVPHLRQRENATLFLSQQQIACLMANAFFCTFPKRTQTNEEFKNYPIINFLGLFTSFGYEDYVKCKTEKLKCIVNYFRRVITDMPKGVVSFERRYLTDEELPVWRHSSKRFGKLVVMKNGFIEREGQGLLQVDFANKYIGGGVLGSGCVQEEIRFAICPELIISCLFTERLLNNEVVIISGSEQFNQYVGYANTFEWSANHIDQTPRDEWGRRYTRIVAIDALYFSFNKMENQYKKEQFDRELDKAFVGFKENRTCEARHKCAIASGNWGCGAFNGDPLLKAIIQLMAATQADRDLVLFTFNDSQLKKRLNSFYQFVTNRGLTVKDIYNELQSYETRKMLRIKPNLDIIEFIMRPNE